MNIIEGYKNSFNNLTFVNQKNKGQSYARNIGIDHANGKYLLFVDSDDYITKNAIASLVNRMEKDELELLRFSAKSFEDSKEHFFYEKKYNFKKHMKPEEIYDKKSFLKTCLYKGFIASPVLYMVKKDIITKNNIYFPLNYKMYEDEIFTLELFLNIDRAMYVHKHYYCRRYREESIMMERDRKENKLKSFYTGCQLVDDLYQLLKIYTGKTENKLIKNRISSRLRFLMLIDNVDFKIKKRELLKVSDLNQINFYFYYIVYRIGKSFKKILISGS